MSKQIKLTEYGSAIQRRLEFKEHAEVIRRGTVHIKETKMPHYTFHPPRILQTSGIVHIVHQRISVDEWELDWFPVTKVDHVATVFSGHVELLGTVESPKKNHSLVLVPPESLGMRMDLFICPVRTHVKLDLFARDNVIGGCRHYNLICSFYSDDSPQFAIYVATEVREQKTAK